ncbi:NAD(P)H-dependent oxidoreductase [Spirillospora sp. NBC_00431]
MTRVLGLPGSLRRRSYNRILLDSLPPLLPGGFDYHIFEGLADVPLYNEDLDGTPAPRGVAAIRDAVSAADALIIASPEYNFSIPGPLKNALDWLSRPHGAGALRGKVVLVAVATLSRGNGARGLSEINRVLAGMENLPLHQPELVLAPAPSLLARHADGTAELTDPNTRDVVRLSLEQLETMVRSEAAARVAGQLEAGSRVVNRAKFAPFIRESVSNGAPHEVIEERLRNAGIDSGTARDWISAAARPASGAHHERVGGGA